MDMGSALDTHCVCASDRNIDGECCRARDVTGAPAPGGQHPINSAFPTVAIQPGVLEALIGDDPEGITRVLHTFIRSIEAAAIELREAVSARETKRVQAAAHLIKSPSLTIGACSLGRLCGELEQAAILCDWMRIDAAFAAFDATFAEVQRSASAALARKPNGPPT